MTLIKLLVSKDSTKLLKDYLLFSGFNPKSSFHSTLFYTEETPVFEIPKLRENIENLLPIRLNPSTYDIRDFDGNLVLVYENMIIFNTYILLLGEAIKQLITAYDMLRDKNQRLPKNHISILKKHNQRLRISQVYPDFNPHITLSKEIHKKIPEYAPEFSISMDQLEWNAGF